MPTLPRLYWYVGGAVLTLLTFLGLRRYASKPTGGGNGWIPPPAAPEAIPFVQAKHLGKGRPSGAVNQIILHTAETPQTSSAAKNVANYFATTDTVASAHYIVDDGSIYQSVDEGDQAWHAAGDNARSIGIEHAGYAKQSAADWASDYNERMLARSALLAANIASRYGIPAVKLTIADLLAGKPGFASHADVSKAFKKSDHTDPGANFPWDKYLAAVQANLPVS